MAYGKMADMTLTPEERADMGVVPGVADRDAPMYPWGLRISFTDAELEKLGLSDDVDVGDVIDLRAFGEVTSVSKNSKADGTNCCRVEIQLQRVAVENETTEPEGEDDEDDE